MTGRHSATIGKKPGLLNLSPEKLALAQNIIEHLSDLWKETLKEHDLAMQVGGYVPLDDDYTSEIKQKYLRQAHEIMES